MKKLFSPQLQAKIDLLKERRKAVSLGSVSFSGPLLLAPMSMICKAPFRHLMEELGSGGSASELISCHGINYGNEKTLQMLKIAPHEKHVGIQLFGEDAQKMASAARVACEQDIKPSFIDINMGCPVKKVVTKGGGSALLKDPTKLGHFFSEIKKTITPYNTPLTIKIRTGWDSDNRNAHDILKIAKEEGVEFVAIHGRTRTQQYKGEADWDYLESLSQKKTLPLIGNGDLNTVEKIKTRLKNTSCEALMLGRGPLRNPFLFLEVYLQDQDIKNENGAFFTPQDHFEVIKALSLLMQEHWESLNIRLDHFERHHLIQIRKHIIWMAAGFQGSSSFKDQIFKAHSVDDTLKLCEDFFSSHAEDYKKPKLNEDFMMSGHG